MPKLYIAEPSGETVYEIFDDEVSLGRGAANGIQVNDSGASKSHAVVRRIQGHWKIVDLESKNGVRVNGRFRNQHWLSDGDQVLIGVTGLRYAAEGASEGSPAAAGAAPAKPNPVGASPGIATPGIATPASAVAARAVPARAIPAPAAPAQPPPRQPEAAPESPAPAPTRRAAPARAASRRRDRRDEDGYDSEYGDLPKVRRKSNSASIVVFGIIGAIALIGFFWLISTGGTSHNQLVWKKATELADSGKYEEALRYAESNGDPDGSDYYVLVKAMGQFKATARAQRANALSKEARDHFDYQIWRKQAIEGTGFRAKGAFEDEHVVRLLREFLVKYKGTGAAHALLHSEHSGRPALREAMREYPLEDVKAVEVMGAARAELGILQSRGQFGQVVVDLTYLRDMNRLIMTAENWKQLRRQVDDEIENVKSQARVAFNSDREKFRKYNRSRQRGLVKRQLDEMADKYNGIPELTRGIKELEAEVR